MRVYLDTCCLMRPFDDQSYPRIRLETLAISDLMDYIQDQRIQWISGEVVYMEILACRSSVRREKVLNWLSGVKQWMPYTPAVARQAKQFSRHGIQDWDARHLATAVLARCDWFLTTDLALIKRAMTLGKLSVRVANPTEFILEDIP